MDPSKRIDNLFILSKFVYSLPLLFAIVPALGGCVLMTDKDTFLIGVALVITGALFALSLMVVMGLLLDIANSLRKANGDVQYN